MKGLLLCSDYAEGLRWQDLLENPHCHIDRCLDAATAEYLIKNIHYDFVLCADATAEAGAMLQQVTSGSDIRKLAMARATEPLAPTIRDWADVVVPVGCDQAGVMSYLRG